MSWDYKDCTYRMKAGLEVSAGCPVNTDPWPTILNDRMIPIPNNNGDYVGYWGWFLAGELFSSAYRIYPEAPGKTEWAKENARINLIRFANKVIKAGRAVVEAEMKAAGQYGESVGIANDNEALPVPPTVEL